MRNCTVFTPKILLDATTYEEVLEGNDAVFTCSVSAEPKSKHGVSWTSFPPLISRNSTISYSNSVSTLTVSNVTVKDNGTTIMCHSQNIIGESNRGAILLIKTKEPVFKTTVEIEVEMNPQSIGVLVGKTAIVECVASINNTNAKPKYKWFYNDQEIGSQTSSDKFSIEKIPFHRLYVRNVDIRENEAILSCVVSVDGVEANAQARLNVNQLASTSSSATLQVEKIFQTDSPNTEPDLWKVIIPISAGLVTLTLIVLIFLLVKKTKRNFSNSKNQHRVQNVSDSVSYVASLGAVTHPFNNDPRNGHDPSTNALPTLSRGNSKVDNRERLMVNLPPVPPIPTEDVQQDLDTLRAGKKLGVLGDYEDMETIKSNYYHMQENTEHNDYQHMIQRLERSNSHQNTTPDGKKGMPEPLY